MSDRARQRRSDRRASEKFSLEGAGLAYIGTVSRFDDGRLGELFLTNHKSRSDADTAAKDSATVCSLALQHGVPLATIRRALMRDNQGRPFGLLGVALDLIAAGASAAVTSRRTHDGLRRRDQRTPPSLGVQFPLGGTKKVKTMNKLLDASEKLKAVLSYGRKCQDGLLPLVALQSRSCRHKQYGRIETPDLPIVGWEGALTAMSIPAAPGDQTETIPY